MDLLKELRKVKTNDVVHFRDDNGAIHTCLVYGTDEKLGMKIAAPEVGKHWEPIDDQRLSVVVQWGSPVFAE